MVFTMTIELKTCTNQSFRYLAQEYGSERRDDHMGLIKATDCGHLIEIHIWRMNQLHKHHTTSQAKPNPTNDHVKERESFGKSANRIENDVDIRLASIEELR